MSNLVILTDADAVRRYPALAGLLLIRDAGWKFLPVDGVELDAVKQWGNGWRDAIRVKGETDVVAIRMRMAQPPEIVWEYEGTLTDVVAEIMALPQPSARTAPRLMIGTAPAVRLA